MYRFREWYIPDRMLPGLERWVAEAIVPGDFLQAVLINDFKEICARADDENLRNLPAYAAYLYNEMPQISQGSPAQVDSWKERKKKQLSIIKD